MLGQVLKILKLYLFSLIYKKLNNWAPKQPHLPPTTNYSSAHNKTRVDVISDKKSRSLPTWVEDMHIDLTQRLVVLPRAIAPKGVDLVPHRHSSMVDSPWPSF